MLATFPQRWTAATARRHGGVLHGGREPAAGIKEETDAVPFRSVPFRSVFASLTMLCGSAAASSCNDEHAEASGGFRDEPLPQESTSDVANEDDADAEVDDFVHPLEALAEIQPTPLFEVKNDPEGRRYAIGEGQALLSEDDDEEVVSHRGLFLWERRAMTEEELEAARSEGPPLDLPAPTKLGAELVAFAASEDDGPMDVVLMGTRTFPGLQAELDHRIAAGVIQSKLDLQVEREIVLEERREIIEAQLGSIETAIEAAGGSVISTCDAIPCMLVSLRPSAFEEVAALEEVARMDWAEVPGASTGVDGIHMRQGAQVKAFIDNGWDGEGVTSGVGDNIVVGILEHTNVAGFPAASFLTTHDGYRDTALGGMRYADSSTANGWRWDCTVDPCDHSAFPYAAGSHSTGITGVIMGDLTQGQHPATTDPVEREQASGFAPEAMVHMLMMDSMTGAVNAIDEMIAATSTDDPPQIMNMSNAFASASGCAGDDALSIAVNQLYLDGIATMAAAGNDGGSASSCTVRPPGAALGSFTVGAHLQSTFDESALAVREAPIYWENVINGTKSAWGGNATEGQNRSIVSLTAPGRRSHNFHPDGSIRESSTNGAVCCTSLATANVTGAAIDLMDYHLSQSYLIDAPGALYAMMLLMGDRMKNTGTKGTNNPDHLWGAGRLRMRFFNDAGMDAPWYWHLGWTCVDDGDLYDFTWNNGNAFPATVDTLKAAAWWFDERHDSGADAGTVANVNLVLRSNNQDLSQTNDSDIYDNKAWAYHGNAPDTHPIVLRLSGVDVDGHESVTCGSDSILVHYAMFAEDSEHHAMYDAVTGEGIFPESL